MRRVLLFGTFDGLHPGHISCLSQAKKHGDHLTVVVARDATVLHEKGRTPLFSAAERAKMVGELKMVDRVMIGDPYGKWGIVKRVKPHVICVGYDQHAAHPGLKDQIVRMKRKPQIVVLKPLQPHRFKSSRFLSSRAPTAVGAWRSHKFK